jgi:hypothetical protein
LPVVDKPEPEQGLTVNTPREKDLKRQAEGEDRDPATPRKRCRGKWRKPTYLVRWVSAVMEGGVTS